MLKADDVVVYVRKDDLKFADAIKSAVKGNCRVEQSDEISIGGMIGISKKMGLLVDETLDSRLEAQHEWFCENSGLKVTE